MNYLALCKRVHQELNAGPGEPGDSPTTTVGQVGLLRQIVSWVSQAYVEIQESQRWWNWMIATADGVETLNPGDKSVVLLGANADFDELRPYLNAYGAQYGQTNSDPYVLMYQTAVGTTDAQEVRIIPWQEYAGFYDSDRFGASTGRPYLASMQPGGNTLHFFNEIDVAYNLRYQYRKKNQVLASDTDVPLMPDKYHMLIVYLAMVFYARTNESNRIRATFGNGMLDLSVPSSPLRKLYANLTNEQLPIVSYYGRR